MKMDANSRLHSWQNHYAKGGLSRSRNRNPERMLTSDISIMSETHRFIDRLYEQRNVMQASHGCSERSKYFIFFDERLRLGAMLMSTLIAALFFISSAIGYRVQTLPLMGNAMPVKASKTELLPDDLSPQSTTVGRR